MDKNSYLIDLSESEHTNFGRIEFANQPEAQRVFSAIWALESQVNNGGFLQYFMSGDFDTASFAPTALRRIGAPNCADIVDRALSSLPAPLPATQEECEELIDSLSDDKVERFESLDSEFYEYPDDLTELLFTFVSSHPTDFGAVPQ